MNSRKSPARNIRPVKGDLKTRVIIALSLVTIALVALGAAPSLIRRAQASRREIAAQSSKATTTGLPQKVSVGQTGQRSPDGIWQVTGSNTLAKAEATQAGLLVNYKSIELNRDGLTDLLKSAPLEGTSEGSTRSVMMTLPMPDGTFGRFRIVESPMLEPALAANHPELRTYQAVGIDDKTATARFSWTPNGFKAMVLSEAGTAFVQPATQGQASSYLAYYAQDVSADTTLFNCGVTNTIIKDSEVRGVLSAGRPGNSTAALPSTGSVQRTYRLAVAATAEFTQQNGGANSALTRITELVNEVNAVYQRELAIKFDLVANETSIIFTDSNTDGYTNDDPSTMLAENQTKLDAVLGSGAYDVGHVFGGITVPTNAFSFSGVAWIGVVCNNGAKAKGVSTMGGTHPIFETARIVGVAHELGHEFGAMHTYNATTNSFCAGQRSDADAYEPGSGSTIMGYSVCADSNGTENLQRFNDTYFHAHSIEQILNYASNVGTCSSNSSTGEVPPTVQGPQTYTIPASTPFALTATAIGTREQHGRFIYNWDEYDPAGPHSGPPNTDDGFRPLFRSFTPKSNPTRTFPSFQYIRNNANVPPTYYTDTTPGFQPKDFLTGESLPTTTRTMNFRVTVRDVDFTPNSNLGVISTGSATVNVVNTGSAFSVTSPNTGDVMWTGGTQQTVKWNVAGTNGAPINVSTVKISLSLNDGLDFPIVLADHVPNTGTAVVNLPSIDSKYPQARVKVEAEGNIFFDMSDVNFTVNAGTIPCTYQLSPSSQNFSYTGGAGQFKVITDSSCGFNPIPSASFIQFFGIMTGVDGSRSVSFNMSANAGPQRSGTITVGDQTFTVTQDGAPPNCNYHLWSSSQTFGAAGGDGYVNVDASSSECAWSADSNSNFITTFGSSGTGNGTATFNVATNPGGPRTGTITIAGQPFTVTQDGESAPSSTVQFSASNYTVSEGAATATITVTRTGDTSKATYVNYSTPDAFYSPCAAPGNGFAAQNCDYLVTSGTLNFAAGETSKSFQIIIIDDSRVEGDEALTLTLLNNYQETGVALGSPWVAKLTIKDNDIAESTTVSPIDGNRFFVQQQYFDFLNRLPDQSGWDYWIDQLNRCGTDPQCIHDRRIGVSDAFFFEPEFQESGAYVYRIYKAAFGQVPQYSYFMPDRSRVIGGTQLDSSKSAFALSFVQRGEFVGAYPRTMTGDQFVTALLQKVKETSGADLQSQRAALVALYDRTENGRAAILRQVADNQAFIDAEYRRSFVLMEYFGYLRRDPDTGGFDFWLGQMNRYPVRDVNIQWAMVCSFITSPEYQLRFGSAVTHTNQECPQ